jgi:hypothetical protein
MYDDEFHCSFHGDNSNVKSVSTELIFRAVFGFIVIACIGVIVVLCIWFCWLRSNNQLNTHVLTSGGHVSEHVIQGHVINHVIVQTDTNTIYVTAEDFIKTGDTKKLLP